MKLMKERDENVPSSASQEKKSSWTILFFLSRARESRGSLYCFSKHWVMDLILLDEGLNYLVEVFSIHAILFVTSFIL